MDSLPSMSRQGAELVRMAGVQLGYAGPLLGPLDFVLNAAETIAVVGPNGGGKTTFVQTLCGAIPPVAGRLGYPAGRRPVIGYVPQRQSLNPLVPLTALDVTALPLVAGKPLYRSLGRTDREIALDALERAGLRGQENVLFRNLSGGQQQRVLLARAMVLRPEIVVMDEPAAGLDPEGERQLLGRVRELTDSRSVAVVIVSHDIPEVTSITRNGIIVDWKHGIFERADLGDPAVLKRLDEIYRRELPKAVAGAGTEVRP